MDENKYNHKEIEKHWQEVWEKSKLYSPDVSKVKNPFFNLMMFPYPSAEGLHVGNMYAFTGADVYGRFQRMQGKDVLEPIGLDGFGIHSENYAIKVGRHPKEQAQIAEHNFYRQLKSIGNSFDWERTIETYDPNYYKWTQWIFIQMFKNGLAYRDKALVNWCPKDLTVLSDEQVIDGKCERCGTTVVKKELEQWFFRITKYAQRLLDNIEELNWSKKVKIAQKNWIGRSEGAEIEFKVRFDSGPVVASPPADNPQSQELLVGARRGSPSVSHPNLSSIQVFTTRPDTLYGATFLVLAPEHWLVSKIENGELRIENGEELEKYTDEVKHRSEIERATEGKDKTGVILKGVEVINPVNSKKIPILVSDYVLSSYGTGAIMAVPAHDQRDYETAKKFGFDIVPVIQKKGESPDGAKKEEAYTGEGEIIGSDEWNGFHVPQDIPKVIDWLEKNDLGKKRVNFHLRDWFISRQRYWGPPIPMIYCKSCAQDGRGWFSENQKLESRDVSSIKYKVLSKEEKDNTKYIIQNTKMPGWYPVSEEDLPVLLPDVEDWRPVGTGKSPLANHPEFYKTKCPKCGGDAVRETDVSDTFLDSSWYFLRYPSIGIKNQELRIKNKEEEEKALDFQLPWDPEITKRWLPVNQYIGGAEHSVLHLLYSRFVTMALSDLKFIDFEEPFTNFFAHGLIVKDGAKMSKSKGNVVVPDEYIAKYGADTLRCYLMFLGPYSDGGDFRDSGIEGMSKFLRRIWKLLVKAGPVVAPPQASNPHSQELLAGAHRGSPSARHPFENDIKNLEQKMNLTIKGVTEDIVQFKYNTAIAKLMEYHNVLSDFYSRFNPPAGGLDTKFIKTLLLLLAPFAPFMTEELWQEMNYESRIMSQELRNKDKNNPDSKFQIPDSQFKSIHFEKWPEYDEKYLATEEITIVVQINGKRRGEIKVESSKLKVQSLQEEEQKEVEIVAKEAISRYLEGKKIKKVIYVSGKIINFVI